MHSREIVSIRNVIREFLPLMMINSFRDNFHISFFIFVDKREKTRRSLQLTAAVLYAPRRNYHRCNNYIFISTV